MRLAWQAVLDVKGHLTTWWLRLGYHGPTVLFRCFTAVYAWSALRPSP